MKLITKIATHSADSKFLRVVIIGVPLIKSMCLLINFDYDTLLEEDVTIETYGLLPPY